MLPRIALLCRGTVLRTVKRNVGITAPCLQTTAIDPIQKLFIDTIHDYTAKSKLVSGCTNFVSFQCLWTTAICCIDYGVN